MWQASSAVILSMLLLQLNGHYATKNCSVMNKNSRNFNISYSSPDELDYLRRSAEDAGKGLLIIAPDIKLSCYGSILSWSGLIAVEISQTLNASETHDIYVQIWRPSDDGSDGTFSLVGSDLLVFDSLDLDEATVLHQVERNEKESRMTRYYSFIEKSGTYVGNSELGIDSILFQPGDVVGYFIPAVESLGIAYSRDVNGREGEGGGRGDLMVFSVDGELTCGASVCDESLTIVASVIPQIYPIVDAIEFPNEEYDVSDFECSVECNNKSSTLCPKGNNDACDGDCQTTVFGLLAVLAAACIVAACIIGLIANSITICATRRKTKRMKQDWDFVKANRRQLQASSPFIVNQYVLQNDSMLRMTSLADYLQYNMQTETANSGLTNVSWV